MAQEPLRSTAHDLNNLFQVILGSLELLRRNRDAPAETVEIALRATREAALLAQRLLAPEMPEMPRARAGETVLLVEDNADVRRWAAAALEGLGYRVLQAADAAAALALAASPAAARLDLLFTDVLLPGGASGRDLAAALAARRAGVPALFTTGYPRESRAREEKVDLEKPYGLARLAVTVRAAIDSR